MAEVVQRGLTLEGYSLALASSPWHLSPDLLYCEEVPPQTPAAMDFTCLDDAFLASKAMSPPSVVSVRDLVTLT